MTMFKPDQPIVRSADDALGRASFAGHLAGALQAYTSQETLVLGLAGPWGSGKTSLINMTLEALESAMAAEPESKRPIIVRFNPWNYSDQNQLISQFFAQLSSALGRSDNAQAAKDAGKQLQAYAKFFVPLRLIPGAGEYARLIQELIQGAGDAAVGWGELKEGDLAAIREELDEQLGKLDQKLVVVIDDIDRLPAGEIRQVFQLVKALADFPNTIYLLSFDRRVVLNALDKVQEGDNVVYLEKIVQVVFDLPEADMADIEKLLFDQLDEVLRTTPESDWDQTYWGNVYQGGLRHLFENLRDVTRFLNTYRFVHGVIGRELNPVDLIAITALQVLEPGVHREIAAHRSILTRPSSSVRGVAEEEQATLKAACDRIVAAANRLSPDAMKELLQRLFPTAQAAYSNISYSVDHWREWRRDGRIGSPDVVDQFFKLALPSHDVSRVEMERIIGLAHDPETMKREVMELVQQGRGRRFLERLEDYTRTDFPLEHAGSLLGVLFASEGAWSEEKPGFFGLDDHMLVIRSMFRLLERMPSQAERFSTLRSALEAAPGALQIVIRAVVVLGQQHGKFSERQPAPEKDRLVDSSQLAQLEELTLERIREYAAGKHVAAERLTPLLYAWRAWAGEEEVQAFLDAWLEDDVALVDFIAQFESSGYTSNLGIIGLPDRVPTRHTRINVKGLSAFIDVEDAANRLRSLIESDDVAALDDGKLAIATEFVRIVERGGWDKEMFGFDAD